MDLHAAASVSRRATARNLRAISWTPAPLGGELVGQAVLTDLVAVWSVRALLCTARGLRLVGLPGSLEQAGLRAIDCLVLDPAWRARWRCA